MIRNKDIASLTELKNNEAHLRSLLMSIGASEEIIKTPAHSEKLERILKEIIESIIDVLQNERLECGYNIQFEEDDTLKVRIESFSLQDDYELKIDENNYFFNSRFISRVRIGGKEVHGSLEKNKL